jgi:fucose 4-O-acetylase-like acetyltransferase
MFMRFPCVLYEDLSIINRTSWVDYAKAIGIILVVYGHVARGLFNAGIDLPFSMYMLVDSIVYSFHMPLFFFLSGLFFSYSFTKRGAIGLTLNKIDSIIYPYLVWSIVQGAVESLLSNYTNGTITLSAVFSLWEPRAQFWFLYALFFVFLFSCVIFNIFSEKYVVLIFLLALFMYMGSSVVPELKPISYISNNLVYFILGMLFAKYDCSRFFSSTGSVLITAFVFILSQYIFHSYLGKLYTDKGVEALLLAVVSILCIFWQGVVSELF